MEQALQLLLTEIVKITSDLKPSIYLYGSYVYNDFKLGWSDIDFICFFQGKITAEQSNKLLKLRSQFKLTHTGNEYFSLFEGVFLNIDSYINKQKDVIVYWGTSGERIKEEHRLTSFDLLSLLDNGNLLYGEDIRNRLTRPSLNDIINDTIYHKDTIRKIIENPTPSVYTINWLLDISRCIYTLKTQKIISKTEAGKWALKNNICNVKESLSKALEIRMNPQYYLHNPEILKWSATLGNDISKYIDVLEEYIDKS